jgi:hypothetical protein
VLDITAHVASTPTNVLQTSITPGFVCGIKSGDTDNVTVIPITSSGFGTAKVNDMGNGNAKTNVVCSKGGSTTLLMTYETDNMTVWSVGSDGTLTVWNDNLTTNANFAAIQPIAFATSPNGNRAVAVGWYDNTSIFPQIVSFSPTAATQTSLDNGSFNREAEATDNGTRFAAASWANDGSAGGALWVATSYDNATGGYAIIKFVDNGTVADKWSAFHVGGGATAANDNISSMSLTHDTDDNLPVIALSYDPTAGDVFVGKYDNTSCSATVKGGTGCTVESLISTATLASGDMPVSIAGSADGSTFAVGYVSATNDNATIQIFYDE